MSGGIAVCIVGCAAGKIAREQAENQLAKVRASFRARRAAATRKRRKILT